MHSKKAWIYLSVSIVIIVGFYISVSTLIDKSTYGPQEISDVLNEEEARRTNESVFYPPGEEFMAQGGLSHSELVGDYARDYIESYRQAHPSSYPVLSGSCDLFGNVWSFLMWDGEKSEIILIYYDKQSSSVVEKTILITQEDFRDVIS